MSTTVQPKPKPSQTRYSATRSGTVQQHKGDLACSGPIPIDEDEENSNQTINDVELLKKGILKTSTKGPHTILLVGEPGVGKSSFLQLIANVITGRDIDHVAFDILDHTNEQGLSNNKTRTHSARIYEITSTNGVVVRILDTPGLVKDGPHRESVANQIKNHIESVTAVLILANGTIPSSTIGIGHTLSALSSIFPEAPTKNIAVMFTNVSSPLCWNVCEDTFPAILDDAPQFQIDNPIALQKKYLDPRGIPDMKEMRVEFRKFVKAAEQDALKMIVELFDWLDDLEPQPTTIPPMVQQAAKEANNLTIIRMPASKPKPASNSTNPYTFVPNSRLVCVLVVILFPWIQLVLCSLSRAESRR